MQIYCQLKDHKAILENQVVAQAKGYPLVEVEPAYDGSLWEKGFAPEKPSPTKEEIKQLRKEYRHIHIDDNTAERSRKMANGSWTEENEAEYLALDAEITAYIEEHYPYPAEQGAANE